MKKIFLDTSVISAYYDARKPTRQHITQKWFEYESKQYELFVSSLVLEEIGNTSDKKLRQKMLRFVRQWKMNAVLVSEDIERLAAKYRKVILRGKVNDTVHIATATWHGFDAIASWNFRHIVNLKTMNAIHQVNQQNGFAFVEIITLQELGGNKYGSL